MITYPRDLKAKYWTRELKKLNIELVVEQTKLRFLLFRLMRHGCTGYDVFMFRYVLPGTNALTALAQIGYVLFAYYLSRVRGARVVWLCHNLDRGSWHGHRRYRLLTAPARRWLARRVDHVFVTDDLLVGRLQLQFEEMRSVSALCFGDLRDNFPEYGGDAASARRELGLSEGAVVGCYVGNVSDYKGLDLLTRLPGLEQPDGEVEGIRMVVAGPTGSRPGARALRAALAENPAVTNFARYVTDEVPIIMAASDFFYVAHDDVSVPAAIYLAASFGVPVLTVAGTFTAEMVCHYGLGAACDGTLDGFRAGAKQLSDPEERIRVEGNMERFLTSHSWTEAANRLSEGLRARGR